MANSLRLGRHASTVRIAFVGSATELYAGPQNFTCGLRLFHVMCRREKSAHMLVDFSDVRKSTFIVWGYFPEIPARPQPRVTFSRSVSVHPPLRC